MAYIKRSSAILICAILLSAGAGYGAVCTKVTKPEKCGNCTLADGVYTCTAVSPAQPPDGKGACDKGCPPITGGANCTTTQLTMNYIDACNSNNCNLVYYEGKMYCPRSVNASTNAITLPLIYTGFNVIGDGDLFLRPSTSTPLAITYTLPKSFTVTGIDVTKNPNGCDLASVASGNTLTLYDPGTTGCQGQYVFTINYTSGGLKFESDPTVYNSSPGNPIIKLNK